MKIEEVFRVRCRTDTRKTQLVYDILDRDPGRATRAKAPRMAAVKRQKKKMEGK